MMERRKRQVDPSGRKREKLDKWVVNTVRKEERISYRNNDTGTFVGI